MTKSEDIGDVVTVHSAQWISPQCWLCYPLLQYVCMYSAQCTFAMHTCTDGWNGVKGFTGVKGHGVKGQGPKGQGHSIKGQGHGINRSWPTHIMTINNEYILPEKSTFL